MTTKRNHVQGKRAKRGVAGLERDCGDTFVGE